MDERASRRFVIYIRVAVNNDAVNGRALTSRDSATMYFGAKRPPFDSYAARWRGTAVDKFNGLGFVASTTSRRSGRLKTSWRRQSEQLRVFVRSRRRQRVARGEFTDHDVDVIVTK